MVIIIATIALIGACIGAIYLLRGHDVAFVDEPSEAKTGNFLDLANCILLFGDSTNDATSTAQRKELKRILRPLLASGHHILEIYGENAPTRNGESLSWIDTPLLRRTFQVEKGFGLFFINSEGRTSLHGLQPLPAKAILGFLESSSFCPARRGE